jgi:hypothetical protein
MLTQQRTKAAERISRLLYSMHREESKQRDSLLFFLYSMGNIL